MAQRAVARCHTAWWQPALLCASTYKHSQIPEIPQFVAQKTLGAKKWIARMSFVQNRVQAGQEQVTTHSLAEAGST